MQNRLRCSLFVLSVTVFANAKAVSAFPAPSGSLSATSAESALSLSDVQQEEVENWLASADGYYDTKQFSLAISAYLHAASILAQSSKKNDQRLLGTTYTNVAQSYKRLKERTETVVYYRKALAIFTALNDKKYMARTLNTLAEAERYINELEKALQCSMLSLRIHSEIDDPEGEAKAFMGAAIIYRHIGRYDASLEHAYKAYQYFKRVNAPNRIAKAANEMGLVYTRLMQFDNAERFYLTTIGLPKDKLEPRTLATALREMGVSKWHSSDYSTALNFAQRAYDIYKAENEVEKLSLTTRIIADIYRDSGQPKLAKTRYEESLNYAEASGNKLNQTKSLVHLGELLINQSAASAVPLLLRAQQLAAEINDTAYLLYSYRALRKADKKRGNIAGSLAYAEKEIQMITILKDEEIAKQMALSNASLYSRTLEMELNDLREDAKLSQLELDKKSDEVEIANQRNTIAELELTKNKYASLALALMLAVCLLFSAFIYRSFSAAKKRNAELDKLATQDPLTRCYNRRYLFDYLNEDFANPPLAENYSLIMVDIDHFKAINDTYGHTAGDKVLEEIAAILTHTVNDTGIVTRYGGEEFCIVLPTSTINSAIDIAHTIKNKVSTYKHGDIEVTCSIGVSSMAFTANTPSELIEQADAALFHSKHKGRNSVTSWNEIAP